MLKIPIFKFSTKISMELLKQLREITGSPIAHCKDALELKNGDIEAAKQYLKEKGLS